MSRTELFLVPESGPIECYQEFSNAFRGAMLVWTRICERYLHREIFGMTIGPDNGLRPVWDLAKDEQVPMEHRIVMASTFDDVMVKREDLPQLIAAFEKFCQDFNDPGHLPEQVVALKALANDPRCYAVCWNQTSVNADVWMVQECEESRRYDISRDTGHWFLFQESEHIGITRRV